MKEIQILQQNNTHTKSILMNVSFMYIFHVTFTFIYRIRIQGGWNIIISKVPNL